MAQEIVDNEVGSLNTLCDKINLWATEKGWNDTPDSVSFKAEQIALMHSELSECLEYVRQKGKECPRCHTHDFTFGHNNVATCRCCKYEFSREEMESHAVRDNHIPIPGEHAELADLAIRLFHYCGRRNINLGEAVRMKHAYNINRPYRHGKNI